jgi:hypothetical protein
MSAVVPKGRAEIMDFWPTFIAAVTTIMLNVLLFVDWVDRHKGPNESTKADGPEKVDESSE